MEGVGDICTGSERRRVEGDVEEEAVGGCREDEVVGGCRRGEGASPSIDGLESALSARAFAGTAEPPPLASRVLHAAHLHPSLSPSMTAPAAAASSDSSLKLRLQKYGGKHGVAGGGSAPLLIQHCGGSFGGGGRRWQDR